MTDAAEAAPVATTTEPAPASQPDIAPATQTPSTGVEGKPASATAAQASPTVDKTAAPVDKAAPEAPKDGAEVKPEPVYNLKLPDASVDSDGKILNEFTDLAKKEGLSPEVAQKVVDFAPKLSERIAQANMQVWQETNATWQNDVKTDPEIGGKNWTTTEKNLAYVRDTFTNNPEEKAALLQAGALTGAFNNPHIVKFIARMAAQLSEGSFVPAKGASGAKGNGASALYPTMKSAQ